MEQCNVLATELGKLPTLYIFSAFHSALVDANVQHIRDGSPIGNPAPLSCTTIFPNLASASLMPAIVDEYINNEIKLGHMSGPFSWIQTHAIFDGHFCTIPIRLVPKAGNKFHMVQNLSKRDLSGISVNSQLCSDNFPTRWFSAWMLHTESDRGSE
jgi:hypothetical protein